MIKSSHIEDMDITYTSMTQKNIVYTPLACNIIKYGLPELHLSQK